ncbi:TIGR01212 family radical SAM protein, partial [bacterium]|nr:TIGR01212 family radical SAM protein [bacterium]
MKRVLYHFKDFLAGHFEGPVRKLPLHAHLGCPHRDAETGSGGCIYCYNPGFSGIADAGAVDVRAQLRTAIEKHRAKGGKTRFIAYFQTETNTHAPLETLRDLWESVLEYPQEIIGLSVSTRPDCLSTEILSCLSDFSGKLMVWVETGLQSANDRTLERIRRGHDVECFRHAADLIRRHPALLHCVHIILGLPGEKLEDMRSTIAEVNRARPHGVKIHHLQIVRHTD